MIVAQVKLLNGDHVTEYANDHKEMFNTKLLPYIEQIKSVKTTTISLRDMRQGRENKKEAPET